MKHGWNTERDRRRKNSVFDPCLIAATFWLSTAAERPGSSIPVRNCRARTRNPQHERFVQTSFLFSTAATLSELSLFRESYCPCGGLEVRIWKQGPM